MKFGNDTQTPPSRSPDHSSWAGPVTAAFAIHISDQKNVFTDASTVRVFENALTAQATQFGCEAIVYVFMPDHCHVVLKGKSGMSEPLLAMKSFKEVTHRWLQQNHPDVEWSELRQDQILPEEDISDQVQRILNNPVRKGMVKHWREYKFKGSTIYDFDSWLYPI